MRTIALQQLCVLITEGGEALSLLFLLRAAWEVQAGLN